uniref:Uncharacterized protein n=1 Tax=Parascaris univalens TaxID=6257 RepID=A0A915AQG6_PARUN
MSKTMKIVMQCQRTEMTVMITLLAIVQQMMEYLDDPYRVRNHVQLVLMNYYTMTVCLKRLILHKVLSVGCSTLDEMVLDPLQTFQFEYPHLPRFHLPHPMPSLQSTSSQQPFHQVVHEISHRGGRIAQE